MVWMKWGIWHGGDTAELKVRAGNAMYKEKQGRSRPRIAVAQT
jgi:hypothetical protein